MLHNALMYMTESAARAEAEAAARVANMASSLIMIASLIAFGIGILVYFIPTIIATRKNHPQKTACILVNVFLGWTFVGWVVALVWSVINYDDKKNNS